MDLQIALAYKDYPGNGQPSVEDHDQNHHWEQASVLTQC